MRALGSSPYRHRSGLQDPRQQGGGLLHVLPREVGHLLRELLQPRVQPRLLERLLILVRITSEVPDSLHSRPVSTAAPSSACAEHDRQLGGASPLSSLMAAKD